MTFFRSLFRNRDAERASIRRYVEIEFAPGEREAQYERILRESGLQ